MLYYQGGTPPNPAEDILGTALKKFPAPEYSEMLNGLKELTKTIQSVDVEMTKVFKTQGLTTQSSLALKQNFNETYQSIVDLGGKMSDVYQLQEDLTSVTGRNLIANKEQAKELFAAISVTGLKGEELQKSFYNAGMEGAHIAENMLKVVDISNSLGVNAQTVAKVVTDNLDKLNRFGFTNGVEGLAKMAGRAAALRFDVNETFDLAEDLMSPDKAIEIAAAVQRLGGAATALSDPLRLMDLAQNDVEGLQQELGKLSKQYTYFNEETQSFQIMPGARRQLNEVASALGIERKEFEKMAIETAKLEKKMSEISLPPLDMTEEDKEKLANLAQLKDFGGTKEYVVNFKDDKGELVTQKLSDINSSQLALIKSQTTAETTGTDPQERLVQIAENQLGEFGRLAAAQEKVSNTIVNTFATSRGGEQLLGGMTERLTNFGDRLEDKFGPKSEFNTNLNKTSLNFQELANLAGGLITGDFSKVGAALNQAISVAGSGAADFIKGELTTYANALRSNIPAATAYVNAARVFLGGINLADLENDATINDGFRKPMGDSLKTPEGEYDIYEKDYMLIATKLPEVLQKSSETGLKNVLSNKMGDISNIISGALKSANVNNTNTNTSPQKQEVVHNVNFKVSVDGPRNKLSDMLIEELPKNPALMQYIVKHFKDTKSSGGFT